MSDLSKIKVGSTTYDIKDAVAREEFGNYLPTIDPTIEVNPENYNTASLYFKDDKTGVSLWDGEPDSGRNLGVSIWQDSDAEHPVTLFLGSNSADFQTSSSIILDSDGNITITGNDEVTLAGETYSIANPSAFRNALGITNFGALYGVCSTGTSTAAKTVTINGLDSYEEGITITVLFLAPNTATGPTLNVNSLGAKAIAHGTVNGSAQPMQTWSQGSVISLTYVKIGATYVWMVNDYQESSSGDNGVDPEIVIGSTQPSNTNARIWIIP